MPDSLLRKHLDVVIKHKYFLLKDLPRRWLDIAVKTVFDEVTKGFPYEEMILTV